MIGLMGRLFVQVPEPIVLSQNVPGPLVREGVKRIAVDAADRRGGDQRIDDGLLGGLDGRLEQWVHIRQHAQLVDLQAGGRYFFSQLSTIILIFFIPTLSISSNAIITIVYFPFSNSVLSKR